MFLDYFSIHIIILSTLLLLNVMRITCTFFFLFFNFSLFAQQDFIYQRDFNPILESTKDKSSEISYEKLLERFNRNDSSLTRRETLCLLIGFTDNQHYDPFNDMETEKQIYDLNENGEYEEALKESKKYLDKHPLSLRILKEISFSYNQTGKLDSAKYFMDLVDKVMSAMIYSGKGKSPENPIFSLALDDGEQFIPNVGMTILNKTTGTNKNKQFMEIINARTEEGVNINFFFVIQHAKEKMDGNEIKDVPIKKTKKGKKKELKNEVPGE